MFLDGPSIACYILVKAEVKVKDAIMAKSFTDRNSTANIGWSKKLHLLVIVIALETQMLKYQPKVSYNFRWGMTHGLTELTAVCNDTWKPFVVFH